MNADDLRNVEALKICYAQWDEYKGRRYDAWLPLFADKFVIESAAAPHRGMPSGFQLATTRAELVEFFDAVHRNWQMLHYTIDTYVAADNYVVARGGSAWENRRTGRRFSTYKLDWWQFRAGRVVAFFDTFDTHAVMLSMTP